MVKINDKGEPQQTQIFIPIIAAPHSPAQLLLQKHSDTIIEAANSAFQADAILKADGSGDLIYPPITIFCEKYDKLHDETNSIVDLEALYTQGLLLTLQREDLSFAECAADTLNKIRNTLKEKYEIVSNNAGLRAGYADDYLAAATKTAREIIAKSLGISPLPTNNAAIIDNIDKVDWTKRVQPTHGTDTPPLR